MQKNSCRNVVVNHLSDLVRQWAKKFVYQKAFITLKFHTSFLTTKSALWIHNTITKSKRRFCTQNLGLNVRFNINLWNTKTNLSQNIYPNLEIRPSHKITTFSVCRIKYDVKIQNFNFRTPIYCHLKHFFIYI